MGKSPKRLLKTPVLCSNCGGQGHHVTLCPEEREPEERFTNVYPPRERAAVSGMLALLTENVVRQRWGHALLRVLKAAQAGENGAELEQLATMIKAVMQ